MPEDKVTAHGRELGAELRRRRTAAGYNGQDMARRLGWSTTKVSRVEVGARPITEADIIMYLASCGLAEAEIDPILALAREGTLDHRLKAHSGQLPDELKTLIFYENTAAEIEGYEHAFMPGLFQTEDYTRALLTDLGMRAGDRFEFGVDARMNRQDLLKKSEPPSCRFYLHEQVLRIPIGSAKIMHDQLLRLLFLSSVRHCEIRVVPFSMGARGLTHGSFWLMRYVENDPVVYMFQESVSLFLDRRDHTDPFQDVLNRLDQVALDAGDSRGVISDLADEFDRPEENHGA